MDVFFLPEYGKLYEIIENGTCEVYNFKCVNGKIMYMFIKRKIPVQIDGIQYYDITTPYGYGGPVIIESDDQEKLINQFNTDFYDYCLRNNIVSEFIRFHLFDNNEVRSNYNGDINMISHNVIRELHLSLDAMWMEFEHKVRKNVKRAVLNNLQIEIDKTGVRLPDFLSIYYETMKRNQAKEFYYFQPGFFKTLTSTLYGHYTFFHVLLENKIISTELILHSDKYAYSFLGGTLQEYFSYRPNDYLKVEIIKWCKDNQKALFVLGGGYHVNDGIYRYKKAFAPNMEVPFYIGKKIINREIYERLVVERKQNKYYEDSSTFFPAYRA